MAAAAAGAGSSAGAAAGAAGGIGSTIGKWIESGLVKPLGGSLGHFIDTQTDLKYGYELAYNNARAQKDSELYLLDQMKARGVNPYTQYLSPVSVSAQMGPTGTRQPSSSRSELEDAIKTIAEELKIKPEDVVKMFRSLNRKYNM